MSENLYTQLVDTSANPQTTPATSRIGQAINATAQGGVVMLGQDANGICRAPRVDALGTQSVTLTNPSGANVLVQGASAAPTTANQYGNLMMARQDLPTPSTFYPVTLDQVGSVQAHLKSKTTFVTTALKVTCTADAILFALVNNSSMVLRINRAFIYIPPAGGSSGAVLGTSNGLTYYPVFCEARRLSVSGTTAAGFTGGTSLTPVPSDSSDSLASGISCAKLVTSVQGTSTLFHQADAYATNVTGVVWFERGADANAKTFVVRPGEGFAIVCTSNGVVNSTVAGAGTAQASANIEVIFTQAVA